MTTMPGLTADVPAETTIELQVILLGLAASPVGWLLLGASVEHVAR